HQRWSALVHALSRNSDQRLSAGAWKEFAQLRKRLIQTMFRMYHSRFCEEAVDAALAAPCQFRDDPDRRYSYEQDFFLWLLAQALSEMKRLQYAAKRECALPDAAGMSRSPSHVQADRYDATIRHVCRLLFAQYLFDDHRDRLAHVWFLRLLYD